MDIEVLDRMETPATRGRPPKERPDPIVVKVVAVQEAVPAFICPRCGKAQSPRVLRVCEDYRVCQCGACAAKMEVRVKLRRALVTLL